MKSDKDSIVVQLGNQQPKDVLTDICREGARKMLRTALELEVEEYIQKHAHLLSDDGKRLVVRNGSKKEREIQTGIGGIPVKQPRINDKRTDENGDRIRFESSVLPPYLRRTKALEELIPWLYLKGVSTGDFTDALGAILGKNTVGLSATNIVRLKSGWTEEYEAWSKRSLAGKRYVYIWADGIYPKVRLGDKEDKQCLLVVMGATPDGKKELIAITAGIRESETSWKELLLDLKRRGLNEGPELAVGDGALGFWKALAAVFPNTRWQRCWVHKTANVLDKLPKSQRSKAKGLLHDIWMAETRKDADSAFDHFLEVYGVKWPRATDCLNKDREELLAFYDFPAEHWSHIRTTNPIESTFATIRLRTKRTKGHGSAQAAIAMAFKLAECASKRWRKLKGSNLLADVIDLRVKFVDGIRKAA
jgi:transposase-like protein